jgi:hypothetical protein
MDEIARGHRNFSVPIRQSQFAGNAITDFIVFALEEIAG